MKRFCRAIEVVFGDSYLRKPTQEDVVRLLAMHKERDFVKMLDSIDCMHWKWKNCPAVWAGQYTGNNGEPTIVLESVASRDLWIWHAFLDILGSHNDINVLDRSNLFSDLENGQTPPYSFEMNGNHYDTGHYLADGKFACRTLFACHTLFSWLTQICMNHMLLAVRNKYLSAMGYTGADNLVATRAE